MPEFSRRNFLKVSGLGLGSAVISQEIKRFVEKFVETKFARYFFIPEKHNTPASTELLPPQTDCVYFENVGPNQIPPVEIFEKEMSKEEVDELILPILESLGFPPVPFTEEEWQQAKKGIDQKKELLNAGKHIAWGDLGVGLLTDYFSSLDPEDKFKRLKIQASVQSIAGLLSGYLFLTRRRNEQNMGRRKFLSKAAMILNLLGLSIIAPEVSGIGTIIGKFDGQKLSALERLSTRLRALGEHLAPYDLMMFFRNVYVAYMLIELGEYLYKETGNKNNIAYIYGAAHGGIEDFILLGKEVCLSILKLYPKDIWTGLAPSHGGLEQMSSCAVLKKENGKVIRHDVVSSDLLAIMKQ